MTKGLRILLRIGWPMMSCIVCCALLGAAAFANERGTVIRKMVIYVTPDVSGAKLASTDRGREAVVLERTPGWVHVIATLNDAAYNPDPEAPNTRNVTGWILDKGYISDATPKGDQILFGEAADCEDQASRSHGRKGAAADARRLYFRVFDLFPKSPLAGEALYRAADIQWQLDLDDVQSRPSYKEMSPQDRQPIDEKAMRLVHKKFPGTKWADLAEYRLLENKMCGDWEAASKCPEKEAEVYEKYANEHPEFARRCPRLLQRGLPLGRGDDDLHRRGAIGEDSRSPEARASGGTEGDREKLQPGMECKS